MSKYDNYSDDYSNFERFRRKPKGDRKKEKDKKSHRRDENGNYKQHGSNNNRPDFRDFRKNDGWRNG